MATHANSTTALTALLDAKLRSVRSALTQTLTLLHGGSRTHKVTRVPTDTPLTRHRTPPIETLEAFYMTGSGLFSESGKRITLSPFELPVSGDLKTGEPVSVLQSTCCSHMRADIGKTGEPDSGIIGFSDTRLSRGYIPAAEFSTIS